KEEDDAIKLKEAKQKLEPLVVKNFQINYADVTAMEAKIKDFIADGTAGRGKVTTDSRTNSLIVTDTTAKLAQVEKLIQLLDSQPQQVLIEGRVVEASETYARKIGVNFGFNLPSTTTDIPIRPGSDRKTTNLFDGSGNSYASPQAIFNPAA